MLCRIARCGLWRATPSQPQPLPLRARSCHSWCSASRCVLNAAGCDPAVSLWAGCMVPGHTSGHSNQSGMHERPAPACTAVIGLRSPSDLGGAIHRATQEPKLNPSSSAPLSWPPFGRPAALCSQPHPALQEALVSLSAAHQLVSALHTLSHCLRPLLLAGGPQLPTGTLDSLVGPTC